MDKLLWKSLEKGKTSAYNNHKWELNKWYKTKGHLEICSNGFHASKRAIDAMSFVNCSYLALVEVKGKHIDENNKQCWEQMRAIKFYKWNKEKSVKLAIYAAELVMDIFEKQYPKDKRPREAIEAAKRYLKNPSKKNKDAAANAADAAYAAANAADAAAYAAANAANAAAYAAANAADAAYAAADAAYAATYAADAAAYAAAYAAANAAAYAATNATYAAAAEYERIFNKCEKYIYKLIGYK